MHKDDRPIILAMWAIIGTVVFGSMMAGGFLFWSLPYLLGWVLG